MVIGWSILALSFWSLIVPIVVCSFLEYRATSLEKDFRKTDAAKWLEFEKQCPNAIFPAEIKL